MNANVVNRTLLCISLCTLLNSLSYAHQAESNFSALDDLPNAHTISEYEQRWIDDQPEMPFVLFPHDIKKCIKKLLAYDTHHIFAQECADALEAYEQGYHYLPLRSAQELVIACSRIIAKQTNFIEPEQIRAIHTYIAFIKTPQSWVTPQTPLEPFRRPQGPRYEVFLDAWVQHSLRTNALAVEGATQLQGTVNIGCNTSINQNLTVGCSEQVGIDLSVGGNLSVGGTGTFKGGLNVSGASAFSGQVVITNATSETTNCTGGALSVAGDVDVGGFVSTDQAFRIRDTTCKVVLDAQGSNLAVGFGAGNVAANNYNTYVGLNAGATNSGSRNTIISNGPVGSAYAVSDTVNVGHYAFSYNSYSVTIGSSAHSGSPHTVTIGYDATIGFPGNYSIAIGDSALAGNTHAIALGSSATCHGNYAIAIGNNAQATASYAIAIGKDAVASTANELSINNITPVGAPPAGAAIASLSVTINGLPYQIALY